MPRILPSGTVTFLFSDVAGSTKLLKELGATPYASLLAEHRRIMRDAFTAHGGVEVDTQGDAFFAAFSSASGAVAAASEAQDRLAGPIHIRIGLHTGTPHLTDEGYVGEDVHLGARVAAAAHGRQVLLTKGTRDLVSDAVVRDLGEHRLKDFPDAVSIFQLGSETFPPLRTISNTNLPRPVSSFVGRDREVRDIVAMLRDGARLVSLTGPGGTGKTRLAIESASELVPHFRNGVFWVELSPLRDPSLVLETISRTIGASGNLAGHVGEREMLLLLDNFEQVIEAATDLVPLLTACPNLRVLVTTRELLRIGGEIRYDVPPLATSDAVTLFATRSGLVTDATVDALCRRLDDLPLAIELAAARTTAMAPSQILERLSKRLDLLKGGRDADPRQRTLRATVEWSYDLLSSEEQRLFARLGVFRGGWTLNSAEAIAEADVEAIQSLVEKSLIRHEGGRFSMLETIRELAVEHLDASSEATEMERRHGHYFLDLAQQHADLLLSGDPTASLDLIASEHDNMRAALDHFERVGDLEAALDLAGSIFEFWCLRGHAREGWHRIDRLLRSTNGMTLARAKALEGGTHLADRAGATTEVTRAIAEECLDTYRALGDKRGIAYGEFAVALEATGVGDFAAAQPGVKRAVARFRELGQISLELQALRSLAWSYWELKNGPYRETYNELLRRARETGQKGMEAVALGSVAWLATTEGRLRDALALLKDAYVLDREIAMQSEIALVFTRLALVYAEWRKPDRAAELLGRSEAMSEESGLTDPPWISEMKQEVRTKIDALMDRSDFDTSRAKGRRMTVEEAATIAFAPLQDT